MAVLEELEAAVAQVTERVGPAVVGIGGGWGLGSGVVLADGQVLTNAHNVHAQELSITFPDGRTATGSVIGVDVDGDVAVVAVDTGGTSPIAWGADDAEVNPGSAVFALANPGGRGLRVTFGLVSAVERAFRGPRGRRITGTVEHTAPLARGSSGGPIVDVQGRFLGLNTNRLGEGFYAALPADAELRARVDALAKGESPRRTRLGVGIAPARVARRLRRSVGLPERDGLLVRAVEDDSPAARAGLRQGDLIVEAGGRTVTSADDLYEVLDGLQDGASLALRVVRGAEELAVGVTFGRTREEGAV